jgi:hypothetical protein
MFLCPPTCPALSSIPIYPITCNDGEGIVILSTLPTSEYILAPTSPGVGVAEIQCVDSSLNVLSSTIINTTQQTHMPVPPAGTFQVQYAFRCTPAIISIVCSSSDFTNSWQPLQFHNNSIVSIYLSFTPNTVPSQWIDPGQTSTTVVGINTYSSSCSETYFTYNAPPDPEVQNTVSSGRTIYIENGSGSDLAIQMFDASNTLIQPILPLAQDVSSIYIVPSNATYFTATPSVIYNLPNPVSDGQSISFIGPPNAPLVLINTQSLNDTQTINVQYYNSLGFFTGDAGTFVAGSPPIYNAQQVILTGIPPPDTSSLIIRYQL